MQIINNGENGKFQAFFESNEEIHNHDKHQKGVLTYSLPPNKLKWGKRAWRTMVLLSRKSFWKVSTLVTMIIWNKK